MVLDLESPPTDPLKMVGHYPKAWLVIDPFLEGHKETPGISSIQRRGSGPKRETLTPEMRSQDGEMKLPSGSNSPSWNSGTESHRIRYQDTPPFLMGKYGQYQIE